MPVFDPDFCAARNRKFILVAAILASALGFIDGTVVSIAMPAMRASLDATLGEALWISNAYMLTLASLILVGGAAGDRFGLARVFIFGIAVFIVASLVCAVAPNPDVMIPARAVKGIGAALMVPASLAIISRSYPPDERGRAIGIWAAASALTTAIGPILGGALLTLGGPEVWRWLFAINLPLGLVVIWILTTRVETERADATHGLDLPGAAVTVAGLGLLSWGLISADGGIGLREAAMVGAGLFLMVAFGFVESRSRHPMVPMEVWANATFLSANLATFALYFGLSAVLFFLPMVAITAWGISEAEVSLVFVPLTLFIAGLSSRFGALADRVGPGPLIAGGSLLAAMAFAAMGAVAPAGLFWTGILPAMALLGLGMSLVVAPLSTAVMGAVSGELAGAASGVNNAVSRTAGLIAVAAMGALAAAVYAGAGGTASFGAAGDGAAHVEASGLAFTTVALFTAALGAVAALIAWLGIARPQTGS
ncbi:MAG: MFS transporter [Paracoccaceae bacterium]|nr:MFS transporter [Paracoccaceae bacterium]